MFNPNVYACTQWTVVSTCALQVLGRNLENVVTRATDLKTQWGDQFVSVEHLLMALAEDARFGEKHLKEENVTRQQLEQVGWGGMGLGGGHQEGQPFGPSGAHRARLQ